MRQCNGRRNVPDLARAVGRGYPLAVRFLRGVFWQREARTCDIGAAAAGGLLYRERTARTRAERLSAATLETSSTRSTRMIR